MFERARRYGIHHGPRGGSSRINTIFFFFGCEFTKKQKSFTRGSGTPGPCDLARRDGIHHGPRGGLGTGESRVSDYGSSNNNCILCFPWYVLARVLISDNSWGCRSSCVFSIYVQYLCSRWLAPERSLRQQQGSDVCAMRRPALTGGALMGGTMNAPWLPGNGPNPQPSGNLRCCH